MLGFRVLGRRMSKTKSLGLGFLDSGLQGVGFSTLTQNPKPFFDCGLSGTGRSIGFWVTANVQTCATPWTATLNPKP